MFTSKTGHTDVVQLLLSSGAQVDLKHIVSHKNHLIAMSLRTPDTTSLFSKMHGVGRNSLYSRLFFVWKFS